MLCIVFLCLYTEATITQGDWLKGKGSCILSNGVKHIGRYRDDTFFGEGTFIWPDGYQVSAVWDSVGRPIGSYSAKFRF